MFTSSPLRSLAHPFWVAVALTVGACTPGPEASVPVATPDAAAALPAATLPKGRYPTATPLPLLPGDAVADTFPIPTIPAEGPPTVYEKGGLDPDRGACDTAATLALKPGLNRFATREEGAAALHGTVLLPDEATLPEGSTFSEIYYNSSLQGQFKQSTIGVIYFGPPVVPDDKPNEIAVMQFNSAFKELPPAGPSQQITLRGTTAYGFNVPFEEGIHSVMWREGCRYYSVIGKLPAKDIVRIAEGLQLAPAR
ncbi:MAG: hypothetical protein ACH37Z_18495 [Anaerolineae bacterium]